MSKKREGASRSLLLPMLFLSIGLFLGGGAVGYALGGEPATRELLRSLIEAFSPLRGLNPVGLMAFIFLNNAVKALVVILLGGLLGLVPLAFVLINGFVVGLALYEGAIQGGLGLATASLAPHGILEVPVLLLAAALGFEVGAEAFRKLRGRPSRVRGRLGRGLRLYFRWLLPTLLLASAIEVFLTPRIMERF